MWWLDRNASETSRSQTRASTYSPSAPVSSQGNALTSPRNEVFWFLTGWIYFRRNTSVSIEPAKIALYKPRFSILPGYSLVVGISLSRLAGVRQLDSLPTFFRIYIYPTNASTKECPLPTEQPKAPWPTAKRGWGSMISTKRSSEVGEKSPSRFL